MAARMGAQKFPGMGQKHLRPFQIADMPLAGQDAKQRAGNCCSNLLLVARKRNILFACR